MAKTPRNITRYIIYDLLAIRNQRIKKEREKQITFFFFFFAFVFYENGLEIDWIDEEELN